jgi:hypothetical protein
MYTKVGEGAIVFLNRRRIMGADHSGNTPRPLKPLEESAGTKLTGVCISSKTGQGAAVNRNPTQLRISPQLPGRPACNLISTQAEEPN